MSDEITSCPVCAALVRDEDMDKHKGWHSDEANRTQAAAQRGSSV